MTATVVTTSAALSKKKRDCRFEPLAANLPAFPFKQSGTMTMILCLQHWMQVMSKRQWLGQFVLQSARSRLGISLQPVWCYVRKCFVRDWRVRCNCFSMFFSYDVGRSSFCENHVRELRTFFTVVLEPNIHTISVLSETLPDFLKSKLC